MSTTRPHRQPVMIDHDQYSLLKARSDRTGVPIATMVRSAIATFLGQGQFPFKELQSDAEIAQLHPDGCRCLLCVRPSDATA